MTEGFTLSSLTLSHGGPPVVAGLDARLRPGCTALVGPNGSGKSTLLAALVRLLRPQSGAVLLDDVSIARTPDRLLAQQVALLPQGATPPDGVDVRTLVSYGRFPHHGALRGPGPEDFAIVDAALQRCGIAELAQRPVTQLSGGQVQRVWLACTLAQDTPWLLADEPTTYLDLRHQTAVLRLLRDLHAFHRVNVVMVLHDLNQAVQYADRIVVLAGGTIVAEGTPHEVVTAAMLAEVYGVDAQILPHPENGLPLVVPAV